jgi:hypothetical protein
MSEQFAIAVEWPDDSRPFLVHLKKPYFVAEARRHADAILFITTLNTQHVRDFDLRLAELLPAAHKFFLKALGLESDTAQFLKGRHGREFPRFLMARTSSGKTFIVEPDHPSPLVAVSEPKAGSSAPAKLSQRFDTVTQWRLAQMRKYYQQYTERQRHADAAELVLPVV